MSKRLHVGIWALVSCMVLLLALSDAVIGATASVSEF